MKNVFPIQNPCTIAFTDERCRFVPDEEIPSKFLLPGCEVCVDFTHGTDALANIYNGDFIIDNGNDPKPTMRVISEFLSNPRTRDYHTTFYTKDQDESSLLYLLVKNNPWDLSISRMKNPKVFGEIDPYFIGYKNVIFEKKEIQLDVSLSALTKILYKEMCNERIMVNFITPDKKRFSFSCPISHYTPKNIDSTHYIQHGKGVNMCDLFYELSLRERMIYDSSEDEIPESENFFKAGITMDDVLFQAIDFLVIKNDEIISIASSSGKGTYHDIELNYHNEIDIYWNKYKKGI